MGQHTNRKTGHAMNEQNKISGGGRSGRSELFFAAAVARAPDEHQSPRSGERSSAERRTRLYES
jgi:hypothetical protein